MAKATYNNALKSALATGGRGFEVAKAHTSANQVIITKAKDKSYPSFYDNCRAGERGKY